MAQRYRVKKHRGTRIRAIVSFTLSDVDRERIALLAAHHELPGSRLISMLLANEVLRLRLV